MWKKSTYFIIIIIIVILFSTFDLGSSTDGLYFSEKSQVYFNKYQNQFDNLIFEFDRYVQQAVDSQLSPGAAVAVVYRGSILLLKGYGVKEAGKNEKVDPQTVFRVGSVSKGFASVLSGMMVNKNYFTWDDPLVNYLNDFKMKDTSYINQLTIRHILSHTSGFPVHAYTDMLDAGVPYEKIKELLQGIPFYFRPGEVYAYQNVIYSLIGDVLTQLSGKSYNNLIQERIFSPLKMDHASISYQSIVQNSNTALPHLKIHSNWIARPLNDRYYSVAPASGINASASDMAQWLLALTGNFPEIIPLQTIKEVTQANTPTPLLRTYRSSWRSLQKTAYGLGWRIFTFKGRDIVYHGGYVQGYRTEIAFDPAEELGIVLLFNSNTSFANSCIPYFYEMFIEHESLKNQSSASTQLFPINFRKN